jgi:FkbM family methyltransferase
VKGDKFYTRQDSIDNVKEWEWIEDETGLWLGPMQNWNDSHKKKVLKWTSGRNTVIQAGGGAGMYPRLLSNHFAKVYTFEPEPANFQCLVRNCRDRDVWCFNAALGDTPKFVTIREGSKANRGTHKVKSDVVGPVPQMTIDMLQWENVDLIWLDVEGYEGNILKGARNTINKFKPTIVAEAGKTRAKDIMEELGYKQVDQSVSDTIFVPK